MRALKVCWFVLTVLVLVPAAAFAQASITGVVKDSSGAVLPGVTVEAASPVLIEKTRSAVSDISRTSGSGSLNSSMSRCDSAGVAFLVSSCAAA